jgi:hypothetical protein
MRLSKNFTLEEFLISQTAERQGIDMTPSPEIIENIQDLVDGCMQPLRDEVNSSIFISSGFRPEALNRLIGGSPTSAHRFGDACDFRVAGMTPYETACLIEKMDLPYDQVIQEFGRWVHLGVADTLRKQELTAYRKDGKTVYVPGIHKIEDLT